MPIYIRFLFFLSAVLLLNCCSEQQHTLRVAHNNWPAYQPLSLAKDLGMLENNTEVIRIANTSDVLKAFKDDIIDIAAVTLDEALLLQSENAEPIMVILVLDISHGADVIIARSNIRSLNDLKGKRVGVESSALGAFMLSRALSVGSNLNFSDLNILPLTHDKHFDSFINNEIDVVVTFEPVKSLLLAQSGSHVIFDSSRIAGEIVDVLVTKQRTAELKHAAIKKLVDAYFSTIQHINDNPDQTNARMAFYQGMSKSEFMASKKGISIPDLTTNRKLLIGEQKGIKKTIDSLAKVLLNQRIISHWDKNKVMVSHQFLPTK